MNYIEEVYALAQSRGLDAQDFCRQVIDAGNKTGYGTEYAAYSFLRTIGHQSQEVVDIQGKLSHVCNRTDA